MQSLLVPFFSHYPLSSTMTKNEKLGQKIKDKGQPLNVSPDCNDESFCQMCHVDTNDLIL